MFCDCGKKKGRFLFTIKYHHNITQPLRKPNEVKQLRVQILLFVWLNKWIKIGLHTCTNANLFKRIIKVFKSSKNRENFYLNVDMSIHTTQYLNSWELIVPPNLPHKKHNRENIMGHKHISPNLPSNTENKGIQSS